MGSTSHIGLHTGLISENIDGSRRSQNLHFPTYPRSEGVVEVSAVDHELDKKVNEVLININNSEAFSLEEFSKILDSVDKSFWNNGSCRLNVKVSSESSEAIIDIGDNFKFNPTLENLFYLEDLFGKNILEI